MELASRESMLEFELNCCGLLCPKPLLETKKRLKTLKSGEILRILATDPEAVYDLKALCEQTGHAFLGSQVTDFGVVCRIQHQ